MNPNPPENSIENRTRFSGDAERQSANWDIRNAPKNYLSLVLTQGASAFFAFACVWLITKTLGSEGYGGIIAIIAASQVAQVLVNWTSVSVVRFGVDEFIETEKIARTFWLRLFILLPNLALVLLAANLWFPPLAEWLKLSADTFRLVFLHFAATVLWIHVQYSLQAVKMPRLQGGLLTVERVLIFLSLIGLLAADELNSRAAMTAYALAPLLMVFAGMFYLRKFIFARFSLDRQFIKKIFAFSLPLFPFSLVAYFSGSYFDAVFISTFLSIQELGIYSVATQINGVALQFPTLANSLLLPLFVSLQKESKDRKTINYFRNVLPSLTLLWGIMCVAFAFAGYFAIPLLFGAEFAEAIPSLWLLLTATAISLPAMLGYFPLSNSLSTTYIPMFAAIFSAVANTVANFLLIPRFGLEGCAWATVITYLLSVATCAFLLRRLDKIPFSWTFTAMLPALASGLAFSLTKTSWLALLVCLIMSFLVAYWFRGSIKETFSFLKNFRKNRADLS